jgi:hypothetical protein
MMSERHNHDFTGPVLLSSNIKQEPKTKVADDGKDDLLFNKDVTSDVELITNDRDVTLMFLKGFKFTRYFDNRTHTR